VAGQVAHHRGEGRDVAGQGVQPDLPIAERAARLAHRTGPQIPDQRSRGRYPQPAGRLEYEYSASNRQGRLAQTCMASAPDGGPAHPGNAGRRFRAAVRSIHEKASRVHHVAAACRRTSPGARVHAHPPRRGPSRAGRRRHHYDRAAATTGRRKAVEDQQPGQRQRPVDRHGVVSEGVGDVDQRLSPWLDSSSKRRALISGR